LLHESNMANGRTAVIKYFFMMNDF
jgi:hypothetical protein